MSTTRKFTVGYAQTVSKNYQSRRHEFGFEFETELTTHTAGTLGAKVSRAQKMCEAIVKSALDVSIGMTRRELDALAAEFFNTSWQELSTGVAKGDEVL